MATPTSDPLLALLRDIELGHSHLDHDCDGSVYDPCVRYDGTPRTGCCAAPIRMAEGVRRCGQCGRPNPARLT